MHHNTIDEKALSQRLKVDAFVLKYLADINITTAEEIENYLYPKLANLPDPAQMKGMKDAARLLSRWIVEKRNILIWGDYDVDGITGTAILYNFLSEIGVQVQTYIPNRLTEGYGLNLERLKEFSDKLEPEKTLIITVDCGISNIKELDYAKEKGFNIIVTDHHEPGETLPNTGIILNAKQDGCEFVKHDLAGVGTAFYLLMGLRRELKQIGFFNDRIEPNLKVFLGLTALGTVADLVPITSTNRILIKAGFEVLSEKGLLSCGLNHLLEICDLEEGVHSTEEVSFKLAPLINAAGRMGEPGIALKLLTTTDQGEAALLTRKLYELNKKRKSICKKDLENALTLFGHQTAITEKCIIVMGEFHNGVVGITASKLVESFGVPAIVFSKEIDGDGEAILKGSCRSVPGVDIHKALTLSKEFIVEYGGHKAAAGVSVSPKDFGKFKRAMINVLLSGLAVCDKEEAQGVYEMCLDHVFRRDFLNGLQLLEPTGVNCPSPQFVDNGAVVVQDKKIGSDKEHLQFVFRGRQKNHRGVGFHLAHKYQSSQGNTKVSITYTPYLNKYNKRESWQVMVSKIE